MSSNTALKDRMMDLVATAKDQRITPVELTQAIIQEFDVSRFSVDSALADLVKAGELVYGYRDPQSTIEMPCNGCDGPHQPSRPMRYVTGMNGDGWLCDAGIDVNGDLESQGCWRCGDMAFPTRQ